MEQATTTTTTTTTPSQDAPVIVAGSESRSVPDGLRRRWSDLVESDRDWTFPFTILGIVAILLVVAFVRVKQRDRAYERGEGLDE